eukprot:4859811-Prymnesium_polylepis.2
MDTWPYEVLLIHDDLKLQQWQPRVVRRHGAVDGAAFGQLVGQAELQQEHSGCRPTEPHTSEQSLQGGGWRERHAGQGADLLIRARYAQEVVDSVLNDEHIRPRIDQLFKAEGRVSARGGRDCSVPQCGIETCRCDLAVVLDHEAWHYRAITNGAAHDRQVERVLQCLHLHRFRCGRRWSRRLRSRRLRSRWSLPPLLVLRKPPEKRVPCRRADGVRLPSGGNLHGNICSAANQVLGPNRNDE